MLTASAARSRVYFDISIGDRPEGRVVFELVSTCHSADLDTG